MELRDDPEAAGRAKRWDRPRIFALLMVSPDCSFSTREARVEERRVWSKSEIRTSSTQVDGEEEDAHTER